MNAEVLRDLERLALECDAVDEEARQGEMPYANSELETRFIACRRRLLRELEVAGVFDPQLTASDRGMLTELPVLRGFHDAAVSLQRYHSSLARARRGNEPAAASVLDANVSLDWFRRPSEYRPAQASDDEWLAECEYHVTHSLPTFSAGRRFVRLYGVMQQLWYRTEGRSAPCLWRAEPSA